MPGVPPSSALFNAPMKPTKPKETAPQILTFRRRLYEPDSLMPANDQWNPAARLADMRDNYDRLIVELGVSPRGSGGHSARLPRVPASRQWQHGVRAKRNQLDDGPSASGARSQVQQVVATARLLQRVDALTAEGKLSAAEGERLRKLWHVQESLLRGGDEEGAMLDNFQQILAIMQQPPVEAAAEGDKSTPDEEGAPADAAEETARGDADGAPASEEAAEAEAEAETEEGEAQATEGRAVVHEEVWPRIVQHTRKAGARVMDVFKKLDVDQNGTLSKEELVLGFHDLGLNLSPEEAEEVIRRCGAGEDGVNYKQLYKQLRWTPERARVSTRLPAPTAAPARTAPTRSAPLPQASQKTASSKSKSRELDTAKAAAIAGDEELTKRDLRSEPLTAKQKAEQQLQSGRLPSLSPDDEDGHDTAVFRKKDHTGDDFVWSQLSQRLAPHGVAAAPSWQKSALDRVHWKVELQRAQRRRDQLAARPPKVPSWEAPPKSKRKLIERELRQIQDEQQEAEEPLGSPSSGSRGRTTSRVGDTSKDLGGAAKDYRVVVNAAQELLNSHEVEDMTPAYLKKLKQLAATFDAEMMGRLNRMAYYEQGLQQLQLQRQEIEASLDVIKAGVETELHSSARSQDVRIAAKKEVAHRQRLEVGLVEVQSKANEMESATQSLMHVINSLRITRTKHVQMIKTLVDKERKMDADSQFLISSASGAMEERERLRAKMERLKHESESWKGLQLREAQTLHEQLSELDEEHERLEGNLNAIQEHLKRTEFQRVRGGRKEEETRERRFGFLREQCEGWQAEFARVTDITGVSFSQGRRDAVEKVVAIYREKEARNKSLYKYVTEDVVVEMEKVEEEVSRLQQEASLREAALAEPDDLASAADVPASDTGKPEERVGVISGVEATIEAVLPLFEQLGGVLNVSLPRHMQGKPLTLMTLEPFLTHMEEAMDDAISAAHCICRARQPPPPPGEEEGTARKAPATISDSESLVIVKNFVKPRKLSTYDPAAKLHKRGAADAADIIDVA
ncbi:hypothetical protein AB1Y20_003709 [Prymnesium parvum]|uniref:EF-hand domain-containing protein n=1 Tax=Prymnesium parvum TaxID=97485 RepID=A0AB34J715_PRYPA